MADPTFCTVLFNTDRAMSLTQEEVMKDLENADDKVRRAHRHPALGARDRSRLTRAGPRVRALASRAFASLARSPPSRARRSR